MPRQSKFSFAVPNTLHRVGYGSKKKNGLLRVVFLDPTGKRVERATPHKKENQNWHEEAERVITLEYAPETAPGHLHPWDAALAEVERTAAHTRPETLRSFRASVKAFLEVFPQVTHVEDVSPDHVARFGRQWLSLPSKKGKGGGKRSPVTLSYYLRGLSAFYNHLIELGFLTRNPWHGVRAPKAEKDKKAVPTEDQVEHFFRWVHHRYPNWMALHALLELKAVCGCRTFDLCQLRSDQVQAGRLCFAASQTKTKESRSLPLPDELFDKLVQVKGRVYLWERLFAEIPQYRKASNGYPDEFSSRTVYYVVNNLFREYSDEHPDQPRFTPHGLRRRAITRVVMATGNVDLTAQAIGLHPQTARTYYLDAKEAFQTDEVFRTLAPTLLPNSGAEVGPEKSGNAKKPKKME